MKRINTNYKILSLLLFLLLRPSLNAQYENMNFEHFSLKDGLSQVTITTIIQDSYGFIWFATQDGLNRYDGVENKIYRPELENPENTIAGSFINNIVEDANKDLWIATLSGLSCYKRDEDRFYSYYHQPNDSNSISDNIVLFAQNDSYNNIWVFTLKGIDKLVLPKGKQDSLQIIHYSKNQNLEINLQLITGLKVDKEGSIWISIYRNGLYRIAKEEQSKKNPAFEHFTSQKDDENSLPSNNILGITTDSNGELWAYSNQVFTKVVTKGDEISYISHKAEKTIPGSINSLSFYIDDAENIMFGVIGHGLYVYNIATKQFYNYKKEIYNPRSLIDNNVTSILKDNSGVLWLGTVNGISKYIPDKNKFNHFEPQPNNPNWLRDPFVFDFCQDKNGEYWVGTNIGSGLYIYNPNEHKFRSVSAKPGDRNSLQDNDINSIFKDSDENIWVATNYGLSVYDYNTSTFKTYHKVDNDSNSLSSNLVKCIVEDKNKNLWIGTLRGLNSFNKKTKKFTRWLIDADNDNLNNVQSMTFDKQGNLWIGTFLAGLVKMEFKNGSLVEFIKYQADINDSTSINSNQITHITTGSDGSIWIATYGGGLNQLDPKTNEIKLYTTKDGLPSNSFYGILEDNNLNLWLSSSAGLTLFDVKNKTFTNYDINDGLQSNEFNGSACYKDEKGQLFFGGVHGFNVFNPDEIHSNSIVPKITFTDFKIQNKSVKPGEDSPLQKSIQMAKKVELTYDQKDLRFEFAALHFVSPSENQYAYIIEGYDEAWIDLGTQNYVSFKNFPHGEYILRVKAANCDGVWNQEGIALKVIVHPPFWATWWFRISVVLLLVISIWGYIKIRVRNLRKEKEKLEKLVDHRTQEISEKNEELKQQAEELKAQNEEITTQRDQIEIQHQAITDSILYAKRIQSAALPNQAYIDAILPENFILFKPRDNVSGDFYWVKQVNHYIVIAVADCTGHGVPGAIMSMLGMSSLSEIIQRREVTETDLALNELRKQVKQALGQTGKKGEPDDGMDMALCVLDTKTKKLKYSGANNSLYIIQNGKLNEIKADKMPIGYYPNEKPAFTNHEIQLNEGDVFYLFSDGYMDHFGGKKGFKYRTANFQKFLLEIQNKPMNIQKELLEEELRNWMKGYSQTDDILVMGVRV